MEQFPATGHGPRDSDTEEDLVARAIVSLGEGPAPEPSRPLAELFAMGRAPRPSAVPRPGRRRRRWVAWRLEPVAAGALLGAIVLGGGVTNVLPGPAQGFLAGVVETLSPFESSPDKTSGSAAHQHHQHPEPHIDPAPRVHDRSDQERESDPSGLNEYPTPTTSSTPGPMDPSPAPPTSGSAAGPPGTDHSANDTGDTGEPGADESVAPDSEPDAATGPWDVAPSPAGEPTDAAPEHAQPGPPETAPAETGEPGSENGDTGGPGPAGPRPGTADQSEMGDTGSVGPGD